MNPDSTQPRNVRVTAYDEMLLRLRSLPSEALAEEGQDPAPIWVAIRVVTRL